MKREKIRIANMAPDMPVARSRQVGLEFFIDSFKRAGGLAVDLTLYREGGKKKYQVDGG
ncbi:MAG: hypothetical protein JRJ42_00455 [Deltaproteobacteria bacterium]|nr:hypothetical protein [Deltaproteobacteria bacterium]MBW2018941.1 hypothetical protein [Deltaproteobacteria bacterium]MBW2073156.1 hypothetical protein [Deltaproteobacteria bacterium]